MGQRVGIDHALKTIVRWGEQRVTRQSGARYLARARVSVSHIFEASLSNIVWLTYQRRSRRVTGWKRTSRFPC